MKLDISPCRLCGKPGIIEKTYRVFNLPDCHVTPAGNLMLDVTELSTDEIAVLERVSERLSRAYCASLAPLPTWPLPQGTKLEGGKWVLPASADQDSKTNVLKDVTENLKPPTAEMRRAGYTYPSLLQFRLVWWLWKHLCCPSGWHLWDEVVSCRRHYLYCDACDSEEDLSDSQDREAELDAKTPRQGNC